MRHTTHDDAVKRLFGECLDHVDHEDRLAFLNESEVDDGARAEVEALLAAHEGAGAFLAAPTSGGDASTNGTDDPIVGTTIDRYHVLERLGEGGFGVVYRAEQTEPIERLVALKIIKPGMDSRQVVARFAVERRALARMDHPNIARVLDAGTTPHGRPYVAMDLVDGTPITTYCDEHALPVRERLELFRSVCQAVQHAHQKGIVHRDLKPSNVLVAVHDERAVPMVIDHHPGTIASQVDLARIHRLMGRGETAIEMAERASESAAAALGPGHPLTLRAIEEIGAALVILGKHAEAMDVLIRAYEQRMQLDPAGASPEALESRVLLIRTLIQAGRIEEARSIAERLVELELGVRGGDSRAALEFRRLLLEARQAEQADDPGR